jgi:hypothetical protein
LLVACAPDNRIFNRFRSSLWSRRSRTEKAHTGWTTARIS